MLCIRRKKPGGEKLSERSAPEAQWELRERRAIDHRQEKTWNTEAQSVAKEMSCWFMREMGDEGRRKDDKGPDMKLPWTLDLARRALLWNKHSNVRVKWSSTSVLPHGSKGERACAFFGFHSIIYKGTHRSLVLMFYVHQRLNLHHSVLMLRWQWQDALDGAVFCVSLCQKHCIYLAIQQETVARIPSTVGEREKQKYVTN